MLIWGCPTCVIPSIVGHNILGDNNTGGNASNGTGNDPSKGSLANAVGLINAAVVAQGGVAPITANRFDN